MSKIAREIYGIANWGTECVVDSVIEACWELVHELVKSCTYWLTCLVIIILYFSRTAMGKRFVGDYYIICPVCVY